MQMYCVVYCCKFTSTIFLQDVEPQDLSSDDFQTQGMSGEKPNTDGRYQWDNATEDKICDLYEQYLEVKIFQNYLQ